MSVAGKRAGLKGERSGLFYEIIRIAKELKPTWGLFENVPGLLSSHRGADFWLVLQGLRECWPVVGYRILDSQYVGGCVLHVRTAVPQRRRRVFLVCGPTESGVQQIFFEPESSGRDSQVSREAGERVAAPIVSGPLTTGFTTNGHGRAGINDQEIDKLILASNCGGSTWRTDSPTLSSSDDNGTNHLVVNAFNGYTGGADDNDAQARHIVPAPIAQRNRGIEGDNYETLRADCHGALPMVAHALAHDGFDASEDGTGRGTPLVTVGYTVHGTNKTARTASETEIAGSIRTKPPGSQENSSTTIALSQMGVRRLTPTECERLQGFPDGWTCLCDKEPCACSDSPRYRALGNAVTVNVISWLGRRLQGVTAS